MATWDRRLKFYVAMTGVGIALAILAAVGELLHWWNDLGLVLGFVAVVLTIAFGLLASSRFQVRELGGDVRNVALEVRKLGVDVRDVGTSTRRVEANTERIDASSQRIEGNTQRIEGNTQRIEGNTAETVTLLREIRDRLPERGA